MSEDAGDGSHPQFVGTSPGTKLAHFQIQLRGRVQGVGFRPFVYRLATALGLVGTVKNTGDGVTIDIQGSLVKVERFISELTRQLPPQASIDSQTVERLPLSDSSGFTIEHSVGRNSGSATVIPDLATCPECIAEVFDPSNRRYRYPFTNCTHCGPRYSIIEAVPYDRPRTTMKRFTMCPACQAEYDDPTNRRFHAQPNACPTCGPQLQLWDADGKIIADKDKALMFACEAIRGGRVVALKGLGGFQLLVDARNEESVSRLRLRKHRPSKPFALMYPDCTTISDDFITSSVEETALRSAAAPIVLLKRKGGGRLGIAESVAPRSPYHGVMLPYTPMHHLLLRELAFPIVATSGNLSEEPICIDEREAVQQLGQIAELFLVHDRPIARPLDDSVVHRVRDTIVVLRAARGYSPVSIPIDSSPPPLLAVGSHLKNTIAFTSGSQIVISQHIGDLSGPKSQAAMEAAIGSASELYSVSFDHAACDLHPDYHSTHVAHTFDPSPTTVQHHYAHVLSCMAEHGLKQPVLGVSWDGTGLGSDGTIWGGEFLLVGKEGFDRVGYLRPFPLPGGDKAITEPRRSALGLLYEIFGRELDTRRDLESVKQYSENDLTLLLHMIESGLNTFETTSAGRLFDGLASLLGLSQVTSYEGEAAMLLQYAAEASEPEVPYEFAVNRRDKAMVLDWEPMVRPVIDDIHRQVRLDRIAARCHHTLVEMIAAAVQTVETPTVVLTGGCFQNRMLLELTYDRLVGLGRRVYYHQRVPTNDGGISLGQAAALIELMKHEK